MAEPKWSTRSWELNRRAFAKELACSEIHEFGLFEPKGHINADPRAKHLDIDIGITNHFSVPSELDEGFPGFAVVVDLATDVIPVVRNTNMLSSRRNLTADGEGTVCSLKPEAITPFISAWSVHLIQKRIPHRFGTELPDPFMRVPRGSRRIVGKESANDRLAACIFMDLPDFPNQLREHSYGIVANQRFAEVENFFFPGCGHA